MPTLDDIREKYPQYKEVPDADLLGAMHKNFYADTSPTEFAKAMGSPLVWNGKQYEAPGEAQDRRLKTTQDVGRSVANGITFGWADEASAKMDELTGSGTYEANLAKEHARDKQIPSAISIPGEMVGGVLGAVATAPVTGPAAALSGLRTLPAWLRGAGIGASTGALYGAGNAAPGQRGEGAAEGALMGAGVGAALPGVTATAARLGSELKGAFKPMTNVGADLGRALERDGLTPGQWAANFVQLKNTRPGVATLADAGGENVKGVLERVAQTPGAGRTIAIPNLTERQRGQMFRVGGDLMELFGTPKRSIDVIADTMTQRAKDSVPAYDKAMNFNARNVPEIMTAWNNETQNGWGKFILNSADLKNNLQTEFGIADAANGPMMRVIDSWKKQADWLVSQALEKGDKNKARIISDMRDRVLDTVDQHNPAYATARDQWAGPERYLQAIKEGKQIFGTKVDAAELAGAMTRMGGSEAEGYRIGAIAAAIKRMGLETANLPDQTKFFRSPEMRARFAAIMPTDEAREAWTRRLDFEVGSSRDMGRALGNSATARRMAEQGDANNIVGDLVMEAFSGHPPLSLLKSLVTAVPGRIRDSVRSRSDKIVADILTNPDVTINDLRALMTHVQAQSGPVSPGKNAASIRAVTSQTSPMGPKLFGNQSLAPTRAEDNEPPIPGVSNR